MMPAVMRAALASVLNGSPIPLHVDETQLVRFGISHGVGPLLACSNAARTCSRDAALLLEEDLRLDVLHAALINDELRRVLAGVHDSGIRAVVVKGAHLAHAVYPRPELRVRSDSDLLIAASDEDAVERALRSLGYQRPVHVRGRVILGQFHMERHDRAGVTHALDIHWRVAAPLLVERLLPAKAVIDSAIPLPALSAHAAAPALPHALALACLHLAAHHWREPDLLWLYDLRMIADGMGPAEANAFSGLAGAGRFQTLASRILGAARELFPSPSLDALIASLREDPREPALQLLSPRRAIDDLRLDLRYATAAERLRLIREHLFPDREYMRASAYGTPIAAAYARRIVRGARHWLGHR